MLKTLSVITPEAQVNFWEQEIYNELEFAEAYLDVQLLLNAEVCKHVEVDKEENVE